MSLAEVFSSVILRYIGSSLVVHPSLRATACIIPKALLISVSQKLSFSLPDHSNHPTRGPKTFPCSCGQAQAPRSIPLKESLWNGQISKKVRFPLCAFIMLPNACETSWCQTPKFMVGLDGLPLHLLVSLPRL